MEDAGWLKEFIRDIPDFPKPGIVFKDFTPLLSDPRVTHFWDGQRQIGRWYSQQEGEQGLLWDAYRLYGPAATWTDAPGPVLSQGGPVVERRAELQTALRSLLGP